jgi:hypothetical protein
MARLDRRFMSRGARRLARAEADGGSLAGSSCRCSCGAILTAAAVGFAVSVGQYLPTVLIGADRLSTIATEAVALSSGGNRRIIGMLRAGLQTAAAVPSPSRLHRSLPALAMAQPPRDARGLKHGRHDDHLTRTDADTVSSLIGRGPCIDAHHRMLRRARC